MGTRGWLVCFLVCRGGNSAEICGFYWGTGEKVGGMSA